MKFNLFFLILTTLTAVVLSHPHIIPGQTIIQLLNHDLFWGTNSTDVVLHSGDVEDFIWTIVPSSEGNFINYKDGRSVQYNGDYKQLTIADGSGSSWQFKPGPADTCFICSSQDHNKCATAVEKNGGWVVIAKNRSNNLFQLWKLYRLN